MLQSGKERALTYDPTQLSWFSKGEYFVSCGSNKQCLLYSREGYQIGTVAEQQSWIWSAKVQPNSNFVVRTSLLLIV